MIDIGAMLAGGPFVDISLKPDLEQYVQGCIANGAYPSVDAIIQEALELLRSRDDELRSHRDELDILIAEGLADVDAGRWVASTDALADLHAANEAQKRQSA